MTEAHIADRQPKAETLQADKNYFWCACGKSAKQPFCDGSHRETGFLPKKFTPEKDGTAYLCMCKQTANPPYCDGSHKSLET